MFIRLISKSNIIIREKGIFQFCKYFFVFFDKKIRPHKYFHQISSNQSKKYVLFVSGEPINSTSYYRCEILTEQLKANNRESDIIYYKYLENNSDILDNYKHIVWYRLPLLDWLTPMIEKMKKNERKIIFSIDDLLFDLDSVRKREWTTSLYKDEREELLSQVKGMNEFIKISDLGISSTEPLKREMKKYIQGEVLVYRNGFSQKQLEISNQPDSWPGIFNLGFFSGSYTHDENFKMITPALLKLLKQYPKLKLHIGGRVEVSQKFDKYKNQVIRYPHLTINSFQTILSNVAVVLAPLVKNRHNEAKSELRFVQAAFAKRIVIATDTTPFKYAIKSGENGYLVSKSEDWYETINSIFQNEGKIRAQGNSVYEEVLIRYNQRSLGEELVHFLQKYDRSNDN